MLKFLGNWSIRTKLLASSVITLTLISTFIFLHYPAQQRQQVLIATQAKDSSLAEMIAIAVGLAVDEGNFAALEKAIDWTMADSNTAFIYLLDSQGEVIAKHEAANLTYSFLDIVNLEEMVVVNDHMLHMVRTPIRFEEEEDGVLILGTSLDSMNAQIRGNQITTFYISLAILMIGVIISCLFSRMITRPLIELRTATKRIAQGGSYLRLKNTGSDEIGQLGKAFATMSKDIDSAMKALRASREESRLIIETASDAFVSIDERGRIIQWNRQAETTFGFSREEAIGAMLEETIIPSVLRSQHATAFSKHLLTGKETILGRRIEIPALHKDGHEFPIELAVWPVTVDGNRRFNAFANDITERKEAEEELRKLSAAIDQSSNMICITDLDGIITYVNSQFNQLTGYSSEEALGRKSSLLSSGKHETELYRDIWDTITKGKTWAGKLQNKRKNGEIYWERKAISPITDTNGRITNYVSAGEDITAEIQVQQKLIEADKMSAVGMLAAGVAHEFKNYLGGIMGNASLALEDIDLPNGKDIARDTLHQVIDLSERANEVAMSLLTYSKAKPEEVGLGNLQDIISGSMALLCKEMKNRSIEMVTHFEVVPPINVSTAKIQQLLMNLLINAGHAIEDHGVITIGLYNADDEIKIRISDSGKGIPENVISKIFDPFYSTKGVWGKDEVVGTGMGLSLCRNIARESGGDLTVESIVGRGTTFELSLPLSSPATDPNVGSSGLPDPHHLLLFSRDKTTIRRLETDARANDLTLLVIDDCSIMPKNIAQSTDLLIFDVTFPDKKELIKATAACSRDAVPFVTINCGAKEYQLEEACENSIESFQNTPSLNEMLSATPSKLSKRSTAKSATPL